ncbi:hypothetical protein [Novosphingobium sp. BL-52-GroH]|uniref:hypothetical protein n=1 Tax=Novosphingobium sp. BL-52-GroH TaxID=3349877 RepID=UPI00384AA39A
MRRGRSQPEQLAFDLGRDAALERMIEARVAIRAENEAIRWRLRLLCIEAAMLAGLVLAAGLALRQPGRIVIRGALLAGGGCLVSGLILVGLSALSMHLGRRFATRRHRLKHPLARMDGDNGQ